MKFRSFSNRPGAQPCAPGKSTRNIYRRVFDSAGNSFIEFDREECVYKDQTRRIPRESSGNN